MSKSEVITQQKLYTVQLTEAEMQAIANGLTALFNRLRADRKSPPEDMALLWMHALCKMRKASENQSIVIVGT